ncbi:hypothetical protein QBC47DRAFT_127683 [Echria macrotheca]|uniref:Defect at low temperature protein 1 n=1 Tax=Echria macrotheca TaxID=438768 RepID=A0AAJ0B1K2_9PEZI|nr:hypothetical protein QBC47DRAFT_127683 [Echria macrotheca]
MSAASLAFRIVYNFLYYFLYLVLLAFLLVTPADLITQAVQHRQNYNILVIALCYVVTILIVCFIYATRLYINRSVIASIPKSWIPIDKDDVARDVRQTIIEGLSRSAAITYEARPRLPAVAPAEEARDAAGDTDEEVRIGKRLVWLARLKRSDKKAELDECIPIDIPQHRPVWGEIEHPGWASPTSADLPNLQYDTVISELAHLIEAKALTLAPPDPTSESEPPLLDPDAVALLQRPESMGLREYLGHLTDLAVLAPLPTTSEFLAQFEYARFSPRPLSNEGFRSLMHLFAEVLRNMHPLSPTAMARYRDADDDSSGHAPSESDIDNDAPRRSSPSSSSTAHSVRKSRRGPGATVDSRPHPRTPSTASSGRAPSRPGLTARNSSVNTWQFRTAPTTPKSRHTGLSRASSVDSFAQTRNPYPISQPSSASLRSDGSGGSVIRLATSEDATGLPYVLRQQSL